MHIHYFQGSLFKKPCNIIYMSVCISSLVKMRLRLKNLPTYEEMVQDVS